MFLRFKRNKTLFHNGTWHLFAYGYISNVMWSKFKTKNFFNTFDIFPTRCNIPQFIFFWKTALHVSDGISTHHQEHTQLYLQYLVLVKL